MSSKLATPEWESGIDDLIKATLTGKFEEPPDRSLRMTISQLGTDCVNGLIFDPRNKVNSAKT